MKKFALFLLCVVVLSVGCGSNSVTISLAPSAAQAIDDTQSVNITATVTNDTAGKGVTWALAGPGALTNPTATTVTYTAAGTGTATITATSVADTTKNKPLAITVTALPVVTTASLPAGVIGTAYNQQIAETGGAGTLTYSKATGALPAGLNLNTSTGAISGTPTGPVGTSNFTVKVTDSSTAGAQSGTSGPLSIAINQAPQITSANSVTIVVGTLGTFAVTATGTPTPSLTETGALPAGVTFVDNGNGTATLSGTPGAGTAGSYPITIKAHNGVGADATQSFTLTAGQAPAITSANSTTMTVGTAGTFSVTTTGFPISTLTETGALPAGVTLVDNGNGTATLGGTPGAGTGGIYSITIKAHNGVGTDASQTFTLTVDQAPAITSANSATFVVGTAGTFSVTATGEPVSSLTETGALPTGVTFVDNGNGSATLSGTPGAGTAGSYPIIITAHNGIGIDATQNFTLTVDQAPAITSGNSTTFTAGTLGTFSVTTTGVPTASLTETGALPTGVSFVDNANGTATLSGTPGVGTGGIYSITIKAHNGIGTDASQVFTLTVNETPAITSASSTTFSEGGLGTFTVTTSGFPKPSLTELGALPTGVTFADNGNGTGTLSGTPAAGTSTSSPYSITFTPSNGVGAPVGQVFTLTVNTAPSVTSGTSTTFTVGTLGTFTVTPSGTPNPTLTETGALPTGVTFVDNGNGTATLSGTPGANTGGSYPITIKAHNGVGADATQTFTLTVDQAPAITSANSVTFIVGTLGTFSVTTTGTPTSSITETGGLPAGVTFVDNGNGTATLSGTPGAGTSGTYPITIKAHNGVGVDASQSFTLTVNTAPVITSGTSTTFTVGTLGTFSVTTTGTPNPTLTETGALPTGVTFVDNGNGTATLSGTPGAGTAGIYSITIKAHNGIGTDASQTFTLTVDGPPAIPSANSTTFTVSTAGTFSVTATGEPVPSLSEVGALPTGVTFVDNGNGTATLSGTPAAGTGGSYPITITAHNVIVPDAIQSFTLTVSSAPCAGYGSGNESVLNGQYAFLYQGFTGTGAISSFAAAGSFAGDGTGKITGGEVDANQPVSGTSGGPQHQTVVAANSTYTIGSDNRGCMVLSFGGTNSVVLHFAVGGISGGVASKGRAIEFDDSTGTGTRGSGILRLQTKTDFSNSKLKARYAFGMDGFDSTGGHVAIGGAFATGGSGTTITNGYTDVDDAGTLQTGLTGATGTIGTISATTGRALVTYNNGGISNHVVYVVNANELFIVSSDTMNGTTPITSGRVIVTASSFSNTTLSGHYMMHLRGYSGGFGDVTLGLVNFNAGALTGTIWDYSLGSSPNASTTPITAGTATVNATSGRMTLSGVGGHPPVVYLTTPTDGISAFVLGTDGTATFGLSEFQPAATYSINSLLGNGGNFFEGTSFPADNTAKNAVGTVTITGSGSISGLEDQSQPVSPFLQTGKTVSGLAGTVAISSDGTGTIGGSNTIAVTNGTKLFFIDEGGGPAKIVVLEQ